MSTNRKLALSGCVVFTAEVFYLLWRVIVSVLDYLYPHDIDPLLGDWSWIGMIVLIVVSPLIIAFLVLYCLSWVAFAKIDKQTNERWKVFLLVVGIIACIACIGSSMYLFAVYSAAQSSPPQNFEEIAMCIAFILPLPIGILFICTFAVKPRRQLQQQWGQPYQQQW